MTVRIASISLSSFLLQQCNSQTPGNSRGDFEMTAIALLQWVLRRTSLIIFLIKW